MELNEFLKEIVSRTGSAIAKAAEAFGADASAIDVGGGKLIRPRLVHECATAMSADMDLCLNVGVSAEMLHIASLIHDDVIDNAPARRGRPSLNNRIGNHASILMGDYLYASSALLAAKTLGLDVASLLADTALKMSRAELMQPKLQWNAGAAETSYREIIDGKTAALFAACTGSTAIVARQPENVKKALFTFGRGFGMAFQVLDDMLDYTVGSPSWGKEPMKDLKEGLVTLPMILALRQSDGFVKKEIISYLESRGTAPLDANATAEFVKRTGALEKCSEIAEGFIREGLDAIEGLLPSNRLKKFAEESLKRAF